MVNMRASFLATHTTCNNEEFGLSLLILEQAFDDPNTCKLHRLDDQYTKEGG
jgi:hypothetical protein